jgi:asparagine synthase (glutamine-hydrolysing)
MCGICGFNWDDKELLKKMSNELAHRGPDSEGFYHDTNINLAHRRLSIIDLSEKGKQPMSNENGSIWITFNGEIYNFKELKRDLIEKHTFNSNTDTEIIIHAYEQYGLDFIKKLKGMFAFCIYDSEKQILILGRDHMGIKPLYYHNNNGKFIFASEIKAILQYEEYTRTVDKTGLYKYLIYGYTPDNGTLFNQIKKLPPSSYMVFNLKTKQSQITSYWKIVENIQKKSEEKTINELQEILEESVKKHMIADVEIGSFLSGGLDSSLITSIAQKQMDKPINTFSVGFEEFSELKHAKIVSDFLGTNHHEIIVTPKESINNLSKIAYQFDEPVCDSAIFPSYFISQEAAKKVKVVLAGEGADELFGGYGHYTSFLRLQGILKIRPPLVRTVSSMLNKVLPEGKMRKRVNFLSYKQNDLISLTCNKFTKKDLNGFVNFEVDTSHLKESLEIKSAKDFLNKLLIFDQRALLCNSFLMKADKTTMAHSLEERVPFIYPSVINFSMRLKRKFKINKTGEKYILKKAGEKYLPSHTTQRKKQGYGLPLYQWMDGELKDVINNSLESSELFKSEIFNKKKVGEYIQTREKSDVVKNKLWTLFALNNWFNVFNMKLNK